MLLSLGGNLETAFSLPAVYYDAFPPPSGSEDASVTEYPDGGWFEYEPATGRWLIKGIKSVLIEASDSIELKTGALIVTSDQIQINSEVVINGGVTQGDGAMTSNGEVADGHMHDGAAKGNANPAGPH